MGSVVEALNPDTQEIKKYLCSLGRGAREDNVLRAMVDIIKGTEKRGRAMLHLQFFFHLPFPPEFPFEHVKEDPKDFVFIVPGFVGDEVILPVSLYGDLVLEGDLLRHFLQMVLHLHDKPFVKELAETVVMKYLSSSSTTSALFSYVLVMMAKITRASRDYLQLFNTVLENYIEKREGIAKYEKLNTLFRLCGIVAMTHQNYQFSEGSGTEAEVDLAELLEERNFDISNRVAMETRVYLSEFYDNKTWTGEQELPCPAVLSAVNNIMLRLPVSDEEKEDWRVLKKMRTMSWSDEIGVTAHLANALVSNFTDYLNQCPEFDLQNLTTMLSKWESERPKLTLRDFESDIEDFASYYKNMKRFGDKDRDRARMLSQLMRFPYSDIFCSEKGRRIVEQYLIPYGDYETVSAYIEAAMESLALQGPLPDEVKLLTLKMLISNPAAKDKRDELIGKIFVNGAHPSLVLLGFSMNLNNLCSTLGAIDRGHKDVKRNKVMYAATIKRNTELVYMTTLQNPVVAVTAVMREALVSQHVKALEYAKPILRIPSGPPKTQEPTTLTTPDLVTFVFESIIDSADDYDPILESTANSMKTFISTQVFAPLHIFNTLQSIIKKDLRLVPSKKLKKITKMYKILDALAAVWVDKKEADEEDTKGLLELLLFAVNSEKLMYQLPSRSGIEYPEDGLMIQATCKNIQTTLARLRNVDEKLERQLDAAFLKDATLVEIGLLYCRKPALGAKMETLLQQIKRFNNLEDNSVYHAVLAWFRNTDPDGWPRVLRFVTVVLPSSYGGRKPFDPLLLFNRSLLYAWNVWLGPTFQLSFRHYLKFHCKALSHLMEMQYFKNDVEGQSLNRALDGLIALVGEMMESWKRLADNKKGSAQSQSAVSNSMQQALLVILQFITMFDEKDPTFMVEKKEDVLDALSMLPALKSIPDCEKVRSYIFTKVENFGKNEEPAPAPSPNADIA